MELMRDHLHVSYDSLWLDSSPNSPAPIRVNGFKVLSCRQSGEGLMEEEEEKTLTENKQEQNVSEHETEE